MLPIFATLVLCLLVGTIYLLRGRKPPTFGTVISVALSADHTFSKTTTDSIRLLPGLGVEGDCHCGPTVKHRSRLKIRPVPPNLRQVHLIQSELFDEVKAAGSDGNTFDVSPADLGENVTTKGLDLLDMGVGTKLHFVNPGDDEKSQHAIISITGLRNPCYQIHDFKKGLQERSFERGSDREIVKRKAGVMSIVEVGGIVMKGAKVMVEMPKKYVELPCV
ncbi:hypothetical protein LSUE1_G001657 [Lachnellula suecica]|uniref:MOSC domain-containing protein n=1 Tax=Lachnellula suecica TaxID=602035 RepID=A0A8T9CK53_9HELO|nr:hypothetical protein LSUE1_G001657 [Lachnellula suecica]